MNNNYYYKYLKYKNKYLNLLGGSPEAQEIGQENIQNKIVFRNITVTFNQNEYIFARSITNEIPQTYKDNPESFFDTESPFNNNVSVTLLGNQVSTFGMFGIIIKTDKSNLCDVFGISDLGTAIIIDTTETKKGISCDDKKGNITIYIDNFDDFISASNLVYSKHILKQDDKKLDENVNFKNLLKNEKFKEMLERYNKHNRTNYRYNRLAYNEAVIQKIKKEEIVGFYIMSSNNYYNLKEKDFMSILEYIKYYPDIPLLHYCPEENSLLCLEKGNRKTDKLENFITELKQSVYKSYTININSTLQHFYFLDGKKQEYSQEQLIDYTNEAISLARDFHNDETKKKFKDNLKKFYNSHIPSYDDSTVEQKLSLVDEDLSYMSPYIKAYQEFFNRSD